MTTAVKLAANNREQAKLLTINCSLDLPICKVDSS